MNEPRPRIPRTSTNKDKSRIFAMLMLAIQTIICIVYAVAIQVVNVQTNIASVVFTIILALTSIAGFGLYYSYFSSLAWTSLGFNLFIMALCIQIYPLLNSFWSKVGILDNGRSVDKFSQRYFEIYLSSRQDIQRKGSCITGAIRCGISIIVGFSAVLGRVQRLQCLVITCIGCIVYELNRQIIANIGTDRVGTFSIFTFGGAMGLILGIIVTIRQKHKHIITFQNRRYASDYQSLVSSLVGSLLLIILFLTLGYQGDSSMPYQNFLLNNINSWSLLLSMASSTITTLGLTAIVYPNQIRIRQLQQSLLAGGVACGACSFFITGPILAIGVGVSASLVQFFGINFIEKNLYRRFGVITTSSFSTYVLQGFLGFIFAAGYNSLVRDGQVKNQKIFDFVYQSQVRDPSKQVLIFLISLGLGIGAGLISGVICYCIGSHKEQNMFGDWISWKVQIIQNTQIIQDPPILGPPIDLSVISQPSYTMTDDATHILLMEIQP